MASNPDLTLHLTSNHLSAMAKGMKLSEIRSAMPELEAACNAKTETAERFSDLCKLVGLKAGVNPAVLATYITAIVNGTDKKKAAQAEQLTLLFDELER